MYADFSSGFTPQFTGLEELNKTYGAKGLQVLGFPSNEFGSQDPGTFPHTRILLTRATRRSRGRADSFTGTDEEINSFCQLNHGVTFPLMKKSEVNGGGMNEVFAWLKSHAEESGSIKW